LFLFRKGQARGLVLSRSRKAGGRAWNWLPGLQQSKNGLKRYNPMNAIRPKDAEFALIIAAEIDEAAAPLASAG
jgi:hypothetical protein